MKKLLIPILFFLPLSAFAVAATPLVVHFQNEPLPLFNEANFAPGNEVIRTVQVSNNSGTPQDIIVEAINAANAGGLGDKLNLIIKEGDATRYTGTLGAFLSAGEVPLSSLSNDASTTYSFNIIFASDAGNDLQNKTLGFDLCVGFSGGDRHCGDTVIGGEGNTDSGGTSSTGETISGTGSSGGGGGGSSGGTHQLIISNEKATVSGTTVVITWDTNLLATSQVIFGPVSTGPYNLNLTLPDIGFGYRFYTGENSNKVINHSISLVGLEPGDYVYRVVSRASPPTVSYEHEFTIPIPVLAQNGGGNGRAIGEILGASSQNNSTSTATTTSTSTSSENVLGNNLAAAFSAGWFSWWWLWILLILLAAYLIWRFVFKNK
jgi:hypothetical protein